MNREEYIDEMSRTMCFNSHTCNVESCTKVNCETTWLAEKLYDAGYRKVTEESEVEPTAVWEFWKGWTCNYAYRIEDATCSRCGYMRPTVRISQGDKATTQEVLSKLGKYCPNCRSKMSVDY